ncbi:MAG TPA: hypothetical protein DIC60_02430 [Lachnospiraceae bacterium]|nr:hypothetical protein [Lachnospiraceae bacterium]
MRNERLNKKKSVVGMLSFLLALIVFATSSFVNSKSAAAGISLPHITEIIAEKSTFNILEIIPEKDAGSLGYYANGQEPDADWLSDLADMNGSAQRTEYANDKFESINDAELINTSGTAPLQLEKWDDIGGSIIYYSEMLPWEKEEDEDWKTLTLNHAESTTLTGTFSEQTNGEYKALYEYKLNLETGNYKQEVSEVTYGNQTEETYYYNPVFEPIESGSDITALTGKSVYTYNEGIYELEGVIGNMGGLDVEKEYFYIGDIGVPFAEFDAVNAPYAATKATFVAASPGYFVRDKIGYEYCENGGDYTFAEDGGTESADIEYRFVRYKAGYSNNNWIQKNVFNLEDSQLSSFNINVKSVLASDVSAADANGADLIYISAGFLPNNEPIGYSHLNDLSADTALAIYSNVANKCPVIIDKELATSIDQSTTDVLNIQKLARLCLQDGLSTAEYDVFDDVEINWADMATFSSDIDGTFVNGNVYCFNPFSTDVLNGAANVNAMATQKFGNSFASAVYNDGFAPVLSEIKDENFYRQIDGDSNRLEEKVSIANAVRYIINYADRRVVADVSRVRVLEIQPAKVNSTQALSKATVLTWLGDDVTLTEEDIVITTMTSAEFIGKIENINEEYDLVYIGASTAGMNVSSGETVYNDPDMRGLIYSNVGDIYRSDIGMASLLDRDHLTTRDGRDAINGKSNTLANTFRFSGNDITEAKVRDLEDFANAGYPVVIDDKLLNVSNVVNTNRVDNSSFMYNALDLIKGFDNVMDVTIASSNNGKVIKYLGVSKPQINLISFPTEYSVNSGTATSMGADEDGYYYLEYVFNIENATDSTPLTTTYDCGLYLDLNADGRYINEERLVDIEVYENDSGIQILPTEDGTNEIYSLSAGKKYKIRRQMPDGFVGIIPWKLEIVKNNADHIHASEHKYTRIASEENKQQIKVLQITKQYSSTSLLNLEEQLKTGTTYNSQLRGEDGVYYKGIYGKLIADLDDFDIEIATLETNQLAAFGNNSTIYNKLDDYDMIIIGFADMYGEVNEESAKAIVRYIESGRSVLFTHDTTSHSGVESSSYPLITDYRVTTIGTASSIGYWGHYFNTIIRDAVGLDRYGITSKTMAGGATVKSIIKGHTGADNYLTAQQIQDIENADYSVAYKAKSNGNYTEPETQGYTNYELIRYGKSGQIKYTNNTYSTRETKYVSQVNEGQITTYPYNVNTANFGGNISGNLGGSYMTVGNTHEQYFQLNMNSDDIVVWYCLSSGTSNDTSYYYDDSPNDAINAYYIYNKGNVTYSGVGHSAQNYHYTGSSIETAYVNEAKLFVNTMIAAYQSGSQAPTVSIKDSKEGTTDLQTKYFTMEYNMDDTATVLESEFGDVSESRTVYFKISDPNLSESKTIDLEYYYSQDGGTTTHQFTPTTLYVNGATVGTIKSGVVYKIYLPDEVLNTLSADNVNAVQIYVRVKTTIGEKILVGSDSIDLRKVGLFKLK